VANDGWVLFGDATERIKKAGFKFSQDRWEAWVRCGLMERAERIEGSNGYGLRPAQWEKLKRLVSIDSQLFGRRSPEAAAYYAALWGIDVPPDLVADYMIKGIYTFYRTMRRRIIQQSNGKLDPRMLAESDVYKLAKKSAGDLVLIMPKIRNPIKRMMLRQFAETLTFMSLCIIYDVKASRSLVGVIRSISNGIFTPATAALGARLLRKVIERERWRFVDPDMGDNRILEEVRAAQRDHPELILRACRDSGLVFAASIRGFGLEEQQSKGQPPNDAKGNARENARAFYAMVPMTSAFFLTMILDNPKDPFLMLLRRDEGANFEAQIRRLDRITEWQRRRLEKTP
jgi:hypothetical protein